MDSIIVKNLDFCYSNVCVLSALNFKIKKGEFIGLVGPNGGGKSTLVKLILGLLKPDKGKVIIEKGLKIGYIPQTITFDRSFPVTVKDVVLMGTIKKKLTPFFRFSKDNLKNADSTMEMLNIGDLASRGIEELSSGQLKRVLIARAIVDGSDVLIMDEPTESLDYDSTMELFEAIDKLKGIKTIIMISHDLEYLFGQADRIAFIQKSFDIYENNEENKEIIKNRYFNEIFLERGLKGDVK